MKQPYGINPCMGTTPPSKSMVYILDIDRVAARQYYLSEKQRILEDCFKNPQNYLEGA